MRNCWVLALLGLLVLSMPAQGEAGEHPLIIVGGVDEELARTMAGEIPDLVVDEIVAFNQKLFPGNGHAVLGPQPVEWMSCVPGNVEELAQAGIDLLGIGSTVSAITSLKAAVSSAVCDGVDAHREVLSRVFAHLGVAYIAEAGGGPAGGREIVAFQAAVSLNSGAECPPAFCAYADDSFEASQFFLAKSEVEVMDEAGGRLWVENLQQPALNGEAGARKMRLGLNQVEWVEGGEQLRLFVLGVRGWSPDLVVVDRSTWQHVLLEDPGTAGDPVGEAVRQAFLRTLPDAKDFSVFVFSEAGEPKLRYSAYPGAEVETLRVYKAAVVETPVKGTVPERTESQILVGGLGRLTGTPDGDAWSSTYAGFDLGARVTIVAGLQVSAHGGALFAGDSEGQVVPAPFGAVGAGYRFHLGAGPVPVHLFAGGELWLGVRRLQTETTPSPRASGQGVVEVQVGPLAIGVRAGGGDPGLDLAVALGIRIPVPVKKR